MRKLGLSIYPEHSNDKEIIDYLVLGKKYGFSRIFTCLLSTDSEKENLLSRFGNLFKQAHDLGYVIYADVSPAVFKKYNISLDDLSFFKAMHLDGLRLDQSFSPLEVSLLTFNPHNLMIEVNMSNDVAEIDTLIDFKPNRFQLCACFNFYPYNHSGLSYQYFLNCIHRFQKYNLNSAAFITSHNLDNIGPWSLNYGLATLEMHRSLSLDVQLKHYIAMDLVDDIIVGNCFMTVEEFEAIARVDLSLVNFDIEFNPDVTEIEQEIVLNNIHYRRGDISDEIIRSSASRIKYNQRNIEPKIIKNKLGKGDVVINNNLAYQYRGELQIVLSEIDSADYLNYVGKIREEELFLLDYLKPWQKFRFSKK